MTVGDVYAKNKKIIGELDSDTKLEQSLCPYL